MSGTGAEVADRAQVSGRRLGFVVRGTKAGDTPADDLVIGLFDGTGIGTVLRDTEYLHRAQIGGHIRLAVFIRAPADQGVSGLDGAGVVQKDTDRLDGPQIARYLRQATGIFFPQQARLSFGWIPYTVSCPSTTDLKAKG